MAGIEVDYGTNNRGNVLSRCFSWIVEVLRYCLNKVGLNVVVSICECSIGALVRLKDAIILIFVVIFLLAVWFLHLYKGVLAHVCVKVHHTFHDSTIEERLAHYRNTSHWLESQNGFYELCGTLYGTRECPNGYVCMEDVEPVVSHDFTTYNSISSAYLAVLVIALNDYWEWLCQLVLLSKGKWNIAAFVFVIFTTYCSLATIQCSVYAAFNKVWRQDQKRKKKASKSSKMNNSGAVTPIYRPSSRSTGFAEDGLFENIQSEPVEVPIAPRSCCKAINDVICGWQCCLCCDRCKKFFHRGVFNPVFQTVIVVCLLSEIGLMLVDHIYWDMDLMYLASIIQLVYTVIYLVETLLKFSALGPNDYFKDRWNRFEFIVFLLIALELFFLEFFAAYINIASFLKMFRLGRFCPSIERIVKMSNRAFRVQLNFILVIGGFVLLMSLIGSEGFGPNFELFKNGTDGIQESFPSWHMENFFTSYTVVFRAITGEWVDAMWECTFQSGWACVPFFLVIVVIGDLMLVNIFTFFLLSETGSIIEEQAEEPVSVTVQLMADAADCFIRGWNFIKDKMGCQPARYRRARLQTETASRVSEAVSTEILVEEDVMYVGLSDNEEMVFTHGSNQIRRDGPGQCCPNACFRFLPRGFGDGICWARFRQSCYYLINTSFYEIKTIVLILFSTALLAAEDVYMKDSTSVVHMVYYTNIIFSVLFTLEMSIRLIGHGLLDYFTSGWRFWDFLIVVATIISCLDSFIITEGIPFLRCLRVLRLLRVLSLTWKFEPARVVANTVTESFPGMINVFAFGFLAWLIFAFMGTHAFYGAFAYCANESGRAVFVGDFSTFYECAEANLTWVDNDLNFNDIFESFLSLTQIATVKGWTESTSNAVYVHSYWDNAKRMNPGGYIFFTLFLIFGAYYTYVLWFGAILDGFNRQRIKNDLLLGLTTPGDRIYHRAMSFIEEKIPNKPKHISMNKIQDITINVIEDVRFDVAVCVLITANIVVLSLPHYLQSELFDIVLLVVDSLFIVVYSAESVLRIIALRMTFFDDWVNVLDFVTVVIAIISVANQNFFAHFVLPPMLLRLVRLYKIFKYHRWYKPFAGLTILIETLVRVIPHLIFVAFAFLAILIVYAILGMFLFKDIDHGVESKEDFHFKTFGNALVVLSQMFVSSGWESFLKPLRNQGDCSADAPECSSRLAAIVYIVSFLLITYATMFTLLTVLVLQQFSQVRAERKTGVSLDSCAERFYAIWNQYDPSLTEYLKLRDLSSFVFMQEGDFWQAKHNPYEIAVMDIPIVEGDRIFHKDILDALYRRALEKKGYPISDIQKFGNYSYPEDYEPVSTTMWRRREDYCASVIQRAWTQYKKS